MEITGKVIVVTGGASGIGEALCRRFALEGAKAVAVADIDEDKAAQVAREIGGLAVRCNVAREEEIIALVRETEKRVGPIDMFCSNAGIMVAGDQNASNEDWQRIWEINFMAHVYAARAVIPGMIERGGGYLLQTASAAALLNGISAAPYAVSKYAALAMAENLAITYGDQGIKVSVLCPMLVRTGMIREDSGAVKALGILEPEQVADAVIAGLAEERFLILPHPEVRTYWERKVSDYDRWLQGMRILQQRSGYDFI